MGTDAASALADVLHKPAEVLDTWLDTYAVSRIRMPGKVDRDELRSLMDPIVSVFADAVRERDEIPPVKLVAGAGELRELEKSVAFVAATLAVTGATGFDVAALIASLREAIVAKNPDTTTEIGPYAEWLSAVAMDSYATAKAESARERLGEELMNGTPVIQVVQELPAILLVASPTTSVLDSLFGRLLLLCVRVGAPACIADATGLADQEGAPVLSSLERFLSHQRISSRVQLGLVGLTNAAEGRWKQVADRCSATAKCFPYFDGAVTWGLDLLGYRLVKR